MGLSGASGLRKVGSGLDLPIAIAVLAAQGRVESRAVSTCAFVGELGLDGAVRPVPGVLSLVDSAGQGAVVVPAACAAEASLVGTTLVRSVEERARAAGKQAVTAGTSRNAEGVAWKSLPWWQHLGYGITHEEENAWTRSIGPAVREPAPRGHFDHRCHR